MQTKPNVTSREKLARAVFRWDEDESRKQRMNDILFSEPPLESNLADTQEILTVADPLKVFHELGLGEQASEIAEQIRNYKWLTEDIITGRTLTRGHETGSVQEKVIRNEVSTFQVSFELMSMMKKILTPEQFEVFQRKFQELTKLQDTSVTIAIATESPKRQNQRKELILRLVRDKFPEGGQQEEQPTFATFQKKFQEANTLHDEIVLSGDKQGKKEKIYSLSRELTEMVRTRLLRDDFLLFQEEIQKLFLFSEDKLSKTLREATDVLAIDHGWTGSGSIGTGIQVNAEGKKEEIVVAGNCLETLPSEKRSQAVAVSIDLLGQGKAQFIEGVQSFSQADNAKAWSIIHSILQVVREGRNNTLIGHSMGGGTDIYLAGEGYLPDNCSIIGLSSSYHDPNNPIDGNNWNNPNIFQPIRLTLKTYITKLGPGMDDLLLKRIPVLKSVIAQPVSGALVREGFLKGIERTDILEGHIVRFLQNPRAAAITAIGSLEQPGITDAQWLHANRKQMMVFYGHDGDQMCDQYKIAANLPTVSFFRDNDQFPPPFYVMKGKHHYSVLEIDHQEELGDILELTNQLKTNPDAFHFYKELQFLYYQDFHQGNNDFQQFVDKLSQNTSLTDRIASTFKFDDKEALIEYLKRRAQYTSQESDRFSHYFSPGRVVEVLEFTGKSETLTGALLQSSKKLEQVETMLRILEKYTGRVVYRDERLEKIIAERNLKLIGKPSRQDVPGDISEEQPVPAAGD